MKRTILTAIAATGLLIFSSCTSERLFDGKSSNEATLNLNVAVQKTMETRALSDGSGINQLTYAVFDTDNNIIKAKQTMADYSSNDNNTVTLSLAKGKTYKIAFWAQNSACSAYTLSDDMKVTVDYQSAPNNDESRDAFFSTIEVTVNDDMETDVVLKRPFAQINLATTDEDWIATTGNGITYTTSKVEIDNAATTLNILDGKVDGSINVTYTAAALPVDELAIVLDEETLNYKYLSMCYILPNESTTGAARTTLTSLKYTLTDDQQNAFTIDNLNSIPIQRNWRTNIVSHLSQSTEFTVTLDPAYLGDNSDAGPTSFVNSTTHRGYTTLAGAVNAAAEGDVISISEGTYGRSTLVRTVAVETIVIDKNITLQGAEGADPSKVIFEGIMRLKKGKIKNMTFNNQYIENDRYGNSNFIPNFTGDFTFENVKFIAKTEGTHNIFQEQVGINGNSLGVVTFKNCTFECNGQRALQFDSNKYIVDGCTFDDPYKYVVQLGRYAGNVDLTFINNKVTNYGKSVDKDHYTFVEFDNNGETDAANHKNTVHMSGNTATPYNSGLKSKWVDFYFPAEIPLLDKVYIADGYYYQSGEYHIDSKDGLVNFANSLSSSNMMSGKIIKLEADIDLTGVNWKPINNFGGTLDGNNHTISNLTINSAGHPSGGYSSVGLFGFIDVNSINMVVKNLIVDNAHIRGNHYVGAIAGYLTGTIDNCTVKNSTISSVYGSAANDEGDKAGAIAGYTNDAGRIMIKNCKAINCKVDAVRDAGQILGAGKISHIENCTATDVTVTNNDSAPSTYEENGNNIREEIIGRTL